jgi:MFS family permease
MSSENARLPRRTIAAVTIGNAIDVYDISVFALFNKQIALALFNTKDPYIGLLGALFIYAVGYVARPIGGFVLGLYADRIGRKSVLIFGLLVSGLAVVAMAALPTYAQAGTLAMGLAVAIRIIQGFALGAEVGTAQAYLLEASAPRHRGLSVAWQGASQGIAGALAAAIALVLALKLSPAFFDANGWRVAFLIGGLAVPYGLYLRYALPETLNLPEARPAAPPEKSTGLTLLSAAGYIILIGAIVLGTRAVASAVAGYMTTFAEVTLGMKNTVSIAANLASSIGAAVGILIGGLASDRFGRRPVMIWPNLVFLLAIYPVYLWIVDTKSAEALWIGSTILTILTAIPGGAFFAAFTESLPKHIRSTSYSTVYSITTAIFAGTTPGAVAALIHNTGNPLAIAWYLLAATAVSQFAMMAIRESAPVKLGGA